MQTIGAARPAEAADKQTFIQKLIPEDVREIASTANDILGVYTGAKSATDTVQKLLEAIGLVHPSSGPDMQELFDQLTAHLDSLAGSLDWKIDATARAERYGKMIASLDSVMFSMAIWDCNGTAAQKWTWDPDSKVVENAFGNRCLARGTC